MKKLVFIILFTYLAINANSQLVKKGVSKTIGIEKRGFMKFAELSYLVSPTNDTSYLLYYKDENLNGDYWKSLFFKGGSSMLKDLYNTILNAFDEDKGKETAFDLGETPVLITTKKILGAKYLSIVFTDKVKSNSLITLTKSQLNSLFSIEE